VIPADVFVDDDNAGKQDGSALRPYKTVQQAIKAAKDNAVIAVAGGTYPENVRVQDKVVRLYGGYVGGTKAGYSGGTAGAFDVRDPAANPSHLTGDGKDSVVTLFDAGASIVDGFLITGGGRSSLAKPQWMGGGFYIWNGAPTISNNVIEKNQTCPPVKQNEEKIGGGIYATGANISILNNVIRNNVSGRGAGIAADVPKALIRGNTVQNNIGVSDHGGGISWVTAGAAGSSFTTRGAITNSPTISTRATSPLPMAAPSSSTKAASPPWTTILSTPMRLTRLGIDRWRRSTSTATAKWVPLSR
jgi:hypothetical protein